MVCYSGGVNRIVVLTSGSNQSNVGNITVTATTGGTNQAYLPAGESVTQQALFFVQANHKGMLENIVLNANRASGGSSPSIVFKIWVYSPLTSTKYQIFRYRLDTSIEGTLILPLKKPLPLTEQDVVWFEVTSSSGTNTEANVRFSVTEFEDVDA